ncbi:unnamed protein product [Pylaiella littoralis]
MDRDVLLLLHQTTDGESWIRKEGWAQNATDLGSWHGVTTNADGRVVKLELKSLNLAGSLPPELGQLGAIEVLDLSGNFLSGPLPPELGQLEAIEVLDLSGNSLSGPLPPELGQLEAIEVLHLSGNSLSGTIPPELGELRALKVLLLRGRGLFGGLSGAIPKELGNLTALEQLDLSRNSFDGTIPPELGELRALKVLLLRGRNYSGGLSGAIPKNLGNLTALEQLDLSENRIDGAIPKELGNLAALKKLKLPRNSIAGAIPKELGHLTALEQLDLSENSIDGAIPKALGKLSALQQLRLNDNKLGGCVPKELGNLAALKGLNLSGNQLSGCILKELGNLADLEELDLSGNQLSGIVPWQLGKLSLGLCSLGRNELCGFWDEEHECQERTTLPPLVEADFSKGGPVPPELSALVHVLFNKNGYGWGSAVKGNPWHYPPVAVVNAGAPAILNFFTAAFAEGVSLVQRPLKVVLIGKETAGKTSLRQSMAKMRACPTQKVAEESTVHIDVEDLTILGENIRIFDCAGQEAYYASLQLFLTPRALYVIVVDMANAVNTVEENARNPLGEIGVLRWVRSLTYRVPKAAVILVGTKCDLVKDTLSQCSVDRLEGAAATVESKIRSATNTWAAKAAARKAAGSWSLDKSSCEILLEKGMSLVSLAEPASLPQADDDKGWPCDFNQPGLLSRILRDSSETKRAVSMRLPLIWQRALACLEECATRRRMQGGFRGIPQAEIRNEWRRTESERRKLDTQGGHGVDPDSFEGAMDGALLLRASEGGLVVYGSFVFLDVDWLAEVLKPLFSHKPIVSDSRRTLGGREIGSSTSLQRFERDGILEPAFAEELWGKETAPHVLETLESAGLTFPRPGDKRDGLVVLLRQPCTRPVHVGDKLEGFRQRKESSDGRLIASCNFWGGVPPGFIERLLTRSCHLGTCDPFWRFGVLIQSVEHFSVILEYEEDEGTLHGDTLVGKLSLEVFGDCTAAEPWAAMSACMSVVVRMLSEFPGVDADAKMDCQNDDHSEKGGILVALSQPQEWAPLIRDADGCRSCLDDSNDEARRRLRYIPVAGPLLDIKRFRSECGKKAFPVLAAREAKERAVVEQKRIADEAEAKRVADEAEAMRVADEAEAKRVADEAAAALEAEEEEEKEKCWLDIRNACSAVAALLFGAFVTLATLENDRPLLWGSCLGLSLLFACGVVGVFFHMISRRRRRRQRPPTPPAP